MSTSPPKRKYNRNVDYEEIYNGWIMAIDQGIESTYVKNQMDVYSISVVSFNSYLNRGKKRAENKSKNVA